MSKIEIITPFHPSGGTPDPPPPAATPVAPAAATPAAPATTAPANLPAEPLADAPGGQHVSDFVQPPVAKATPAADPDATADDEDDDLDLDSDDDDPLGLEDDGLDEDEPATAEGDAAAKAVSVKRAARRLAAKKVKDLETEIARLKEREIDDESIQEYVALKERAEQAEQKAITAERKATEGQLRAHYDAAYRKALIEARKAGEEDPEYNADNWVAGQMARRAPQLGADDVARIVRTEIKAATQESRQEFERAVSERTAKERREAFVNDLRAEAKKDPIVRVYARAILKDWEANDHKGKAAQYVRKLTAAQRKVGRLNSAIRAEHAREAVPLKHGGGAPAPRGAPGVLERIDSERLEPAALIAAVQSGRLDLSR